MAPERAVTSQEERISTPVMSVPASPVAGTPVQNARSPISILLAVAQSQSKSDDDLTNLNWLHERDLLKGMNISPSNNCTPVKDHSSNTSTDTSITNCDDDSESISGYLISDSTCPNQSTTAPRNKHPYDIPYDPSVHTDNKPPYSFSCLIFMAIEDSVEKALPVKEIYAWIVNHFPYFKNAPMGWKNSVRHNLSLNKCFQKVEKISNLGKGSLWTIDPQYKPNLIQALKKSPINPLSTFSNSPRLSEMFAKKSSICHKPDPGLFPYLAKELAANGINKLHPRSTTEEDTLDAVDAAAVMLSLKNGLSHRECRQVITTSPSQDHTYSSADSVIFFKNHNGITDCTDFRDPKESTCRKLNFEDDEERKIKEGAETLLNLAGVTLKRIHADPNDSTEKFAKKNKFQKFDMNKNETQVISARPRQLRTKKRKTVNKLVTDTNDRYIMDFRQENLNQEDR